MARIFVSHSGQDTAQAGEVHGWLVADGHEVFFDRDRRDGIAVGDEWERRLHERLRWADAVVCVVTAAYAASHWCTAEVAIARSWGSRLLPVLAEPGVAHPLLRSIQHADATKDPAAARAKLVEALLRVSGVGWPDDRSPFPGLRAFDVDQHRVFFGRGADVSGLTELLRSPAEQAKAAVVAVVGPSGCGKSSLVRAGLLPVIAEELEWWALAPMLPGTDPVAALSRELADAARQLGMTWTVAEVRQRLRDHGLREVADELLVAAPSPARQLLVVVDQFEELLTQTPPPEQVRFAELLGSALSGPVQVVATLRAEFLESLLAKPELDGLRVQPYPLRALRREALAEVIEGPARIAGIRIEEGLVPRLVADTGSGDGLPLLAYTLAQLADGVGRGGELLGSRYEQLGGVQGALTHQADKALTEAVSAGGRGREEVIRALLRLVTVDEQGRPTRWRVRRDELPAVVTDELAPFVVRRLLTTDTENSNAVIEVAHEAFLSTWDPLARAVAVNSGALRARRRVEQDAKDWSDNGRVPARLWEHGQIAAAEADFGADMRAADTGPLAAATQRSRARMPRWATEWPGLRRRVPFVERVELSAQARDFLQASIRRDRRRRGRSTTILSALLIVTLVAAGVAVAQLRTAQERERLAVARALLTQAEAARVNDPRRALLLGEAAHHVHPDAVTQSGLVQTLANTRYTTTLTGHTFIVDSVAFAPSGRTLATGGADGRVFLWDVSDPTQPRRLGSPLTDQSFVDSVAFAPSGRIMATGGGDNTVVLWDVSDPARPRPLGPPLTGHTDPQTANMVKLPGVNSVAFSPDGRTLATGGADHIVLLWDVSDPAQPRRLGPPLTGHTDGVTSVVFAPDGHTLATGSSDATVRLWDVSAPARPRSVGSPLTGHTGWVSSVAFSPDGHALATGSLDDTVVLWDVSDPTRPRRLGRPLTGHTDGVNAVAFSPDGHTLAVGDVDHSTMLWDVSDPAEPFGLLPSLTGHTNQVSSVAFSPDGHTLATGSWDNTAKLWNLDDQARRLDPPLTGHTSTEQEIGNVPGVSSVAFTPDGRTLATGAADHTVLLWDASDPTRPRRVGPPLTGHSGGVTTIAFAPDGRTLAAGSWDNTVIMWDVSDPARPRQLGSPLSGHTGWVSSVAFAPDGRTLATGSFDNTVIMWDVSDPARAHRLGAPLTGHTNGVDAVAFAPNGRTLATGSGDNTAILWDVSDPAQAHRLGAPLAGHNFFVKSVAFSPGGRTLATGSLDSTVMLWDVSNPAKPSRLGSPLTGHTDTVTSVAFAPDGRTVAASSGDNTVLLWDVSDPAQPYRLGLPLTSRASMNSVAFAPDGHTLATGNWDDTATLWDVAGLNRLRDSAMERACAITHGGPSPSDWARYVPGLTYEDACAPQ